ncbi:hypothetical protein [Streptomyces erythrochromogenes]|uniref:hypothetical protein n=1 Tax=Streptomyces erythrochromogenes TaxID=285574 RepID=UPI00131B6FDD|nr:hypothetical protein [Streptomyces erythrochromogenes]
MSTTGQVREVTRGTGAALTALCSGSMVLAGRICRCLPVVARWAWEAAAVDAAATAARQEQADRSAKTKAKKVHQARRKAAEAAEAGGEDPGELDLGAVAAPPVAPVRRGALEALAILGFGGLVACGGIASVGRLAWLPVQERLAPYGMWFCVAGGLAWMTAAWMLAPVPAPAADDGQEQNDVLAVEEEPENLEGAEDQAAEAAGPDCGTALLWHVVTALSDAEATKRTGVHLDMLLASAVTRGLLAEGTEVADLRAWVESCGLPTVDKLGMRIEGRPTTRVGVRVDAAAEALGMTPTALLRARSETPERPVGEAPAEAPAMPGPAVGEGPVVAAATTPAQPPAAVPVPAPATAALRLILGGGQDPEQAPSPALSPGPVQEAR